MDFVKRRGSSTAKITVSNFGELKEQYLLDIKAVIEMEEIPPSLVFNRDHTGVSIFPGSSWMMEKKGSKRVEIVGFSDKRQITAVICGTMDGHVLPLQLIYEGKTKACLPKCVFPDGWHVTCYSNHWSNEQKMKEYLDLIIIPIPYMCQTRLNLGLPSDFPALAIFDIFKGQVTEDIFSMLQNNHIYVVKVPANCTDRLQPMDLSVNKSIKEFLRDQFRQWYVEKQLDQGVEEFAQADLRMSIMKPHGAKWLIGVYDHLLSNESIIKNGFKAAGILDPISVK